MAEVPRLEGESETAYNSRKLVISIFGDVMSKLENVYTQDIKNAKLVLSAYSDLEICRFTYEYRAKLKVGKATVRLWSGYDKQKNTDRATNAIIRSPSYKMHMAIADERNKYQSILSAIAKNRGINIDPDVMLFQLLQESTRD